ncbi:hypothetical protein ACR8AC_11830 [Clavibacter sepedonicus]|uniref:hypothetical protein n=1 Tax=Clavibacter sepedonicus TaxID=31964 RepID=UPI003DA30ABE
MPSHPPRPSALALAPLSRALGHLRASRRLRNLRRTLPVAAAAATLVVIATFAVAPPSAHAAEASIAHSISQDTVEQDILSGRISIDQLVDAAVAARSGAPDAPPMSRSEITRQMSEEVQALRTQPTTATPGSDVQDDDPGAAAGPGTGTGTGVGVGVAKFSFKKLFGKIKGFFRHGVTLDIPLWKVMLGNGALVTAAAVTSVACASFLVLSCALVAGALIGASGYVFWLLHQCVRNQDRTWHLTLPDVHRSWCSK